MLKDELSGPIIKNFVRLTANPYSYLKDNKDEDEKAKATKECVLKRKLKFEEYKKYLEAAESENKINYLEKNKIDTDSLKERQIKFIKKQKN